MDMTLPNEPNAARLPSPARPEPRWPALIAVMAAGVLYAALPGSLSVGPRWLLPALVTVLAIASVVTRVQGYFTANVVVGHFLSGLLTFFMLWSVALLITALPSGREKPVSLLRSAGLLWATNVVVFAVWYWRLDAGGPTSATSARGTRRARSSSRK